MSIRHSTSDIRYALLREIAAALNETYMSTSVEISELTVGNETYSVKGTFSITPFLSSIVKKKGTVEAKFDKNLKLVSIKMPESK